jgi:hypothetical protein
VYQAVETWSSKSIFQCIFIIRYFDHTAIFTRGSKKFLTSETLS